MVGIISAMHEEIHTLLENLQNKTTKKKGMRTYYQGLLFNEPVVLVFSRWGKVAAATTATQLINDFSLNEIIFTGVAGSIHENLNIGDIVIARHLYQHDMDASPILKPFEIPLLGLKYIVTPEDKRNLLQRASQLFLSDFEAFISESEAKQFGINTPKVIVEDIGSGDQFISTEAQLKHIRHHLPNIACVEMEGAAVAQVCYEYQIAFNVVRTISDKANDNSHIDFPKFSKQIASKYASGILKKYFELRR